MEENKMETNWNYTNARQYVRHIDEGMPPVIITCATTNSWQRSDHPTVPLTAEEQAADAAAVFAAGARIIHIHGREKDDPSKTTNNPARLREINALIRAKAPEILVDDSQTNAPLAVADGAILGRPVFPKSAPLEAGPDIMALNPGPMTYRGAKGEPSRVMVTSFDDTLRTANLLRERGVKPQVFLYHPGHLDMLDYLIQHDALDKPYFVQLVFGQQSGIPMGPDAVLYMVSNLPSDSIFQTCALGLHAFHVNVMALLLGGHVRTGLEDCLWYNRGEAAKSNAQLVERIVRIAADIGRRVATTEETRQMLGIPVKSRQ